MRIDTLPIGSRFGLAYMAPGWAKTGTLVSLSPTGATVEYDGGAPQNGTTRWGEEFTVPARKDRCTISRATEVVPCA